MITKILQTSFMHAASSSVEPTLLNSVRVLISWCAIDSAERDNL